MVGAVRRLGVVRVGVGPGATTEASEELIEVVEPPPGRVSPQISVARLRALGWQPEVGLEDGLRLLLESRQAAPAA